MKIAFLDRDGVLNREIGRHVCSVEEFEILPDVIPALQFLKSKGFEFVVITNQSGIGLGLYTDNDVNEMHEILSSKIEKEDLRFLEIYYCPHHPTKTKCLCRKPEGGMVEKALAKYYADPNDCIMFGDRDRDVEAARSAGVRGVLIASNDSLLKVIEEIDI